MTSLHQFIGDDIGGSHTPESIQGAHGKIYPHLFLLPSLLSGPHDQFFDYEFIFFGDGARIQKQYPIDHNA